MEKTEFEKITDEYKWWSTSVSTGLRALSLGTIAAIWAVVSAEGIQVSDEALFGVSTSLLVTLAFILASAVLFFDLLQGIAVVWMYHIGLEKWEKKKKASNYELTDDTFELFYNKEHIGSFGVFLYWLNFACFPIKLFLGIAGGLAFIFFTFAISLATGTPP